MLEGMFMSSGKCVL